MVHLGLGPFFGSRKNSVNQNFMITCLKFVTAPCITEVSRTIPLFTQFGGTWITTERHYAQTHNQISQIHLYQDVRLQVTTYKPV